MIDICDISKIYTKNGEQFYANKNINLKINKGHIVGFLGANGAGKTTLIKTICNLINPTSGEIFIKGKNIKLYPEVVHKNVGVVLEGARNLYNFLSIDDNIRYFSYLNKLDKGYIEKNKTYLLELFELKDKHNEVVNNLSRGMQQKVAIIIAILKDPDILILDEPTLGLDVMSKIKMKKLLKELSRNLNKTLIISSHDMDVIEEVCDRVAFFDKGQLIKYDTVNNLKFNNSDDDYIIILEDTNETVKIVKSLNENILLIDDNFIKFKTAKITEALSKIPSKYIVKIEKESNNMENLFSKEGMKNDIS